MVFSPQQIKFEFLSYIKEFGGKVEDWRVGCATDAPKALFEENKIESDRDIWLWKPALSPAAAGIVFRYMTDQFHVLPASNTAHGSSIFLFKRVRSVRIDDPVNSLAPHETYGPAYIDASAPFGLRHSAAMHRSDEIVTDRAYRRL